MYISDQQGREYNKYFPYYYDQNPTASTTPTTSPATRANSTPTLTVIEDIPYTTTPTSPTTITIASSPTTTTVVPITDSNPQPQLPLHLHCLHTRPVAGTTVL